MDEQTSKSPIGERERKEIDDIFGGIADLTLLTLRVHLYTEHVMERLILATLPRGDRVLENGNLSYSQKIALVAALDCVEDVYISGLRSLNKIRNACSHERQKTITSADIDFLGRSFGSGYALIKKQHHHNQYVCLSATLGYLCGGLLYHANRIEEQKIGKQASEPGR